MSKTKSLSNPATVLSQEDQDLLALLLEGLVKEDRARSKGWLLSFLAGPSPEQTGAQIFSEAPEKVSGMAKAIIQLNLKINYNRGKRVFQRKLSTLLSFALKEGLMEKRRSFLRTLYRSTPSAAAWLEEEYGKERGEVAVSAQQTWYNARKLCRTLLGVGGGLTREELCTRAFPVQELPADAPPRLRAMVSSYLESVPVLFQASLDLAESRQWVRHSDGRWRVTLAGVQEFKLKE